MNSADTTSGSSRDDHKSDDHKSDDHKSDVRKEVRPPVPGGGIILWAAEPCRKLAIVTGHLLRTSLDVVNRGRPFGSLPLDVGVVNGGVLPVFHKEIAGIRPMFPFRSSLVDAQWSNVLVTTSRRDDVRRGRCHDQGSAVPAVALRELVAAVEHSRAGGQRDLLGLMETLKYSATPSSDHRCSCATEDAFTLADLCQRAIVGLADGWL